MAQHRSTTIRLPPDLLQIVDDAARREVRTRQAQIEVMIRRGLDARADSDDRRSR